MMISAMPITGGPYLQVAAFCDKVLQEKDGVLSLIRVVDRWNVAGPTETMLPTIIQTNLVLIFKSGIFRGAAQLAVTPISPRNEHLQSVVLPLFFEGDDDRGVNVIIPIGFPVQEPGLYWFEVAITGRTMTNIPLHIVYLQSGPMPVGPNPNQ
jgi:hypothetical protein